MNQVNETIDLAEFRQNALGYLTPGMLRFESEDKRVYTFNYPVIHYPDAAQTVSFDKILDIEGVLEGIKGQYLLLDGNRVLNIRRHSGYEMVMDY